MFQFGQLTVRYYVSLALCNDSFIFKRYWTSATQNILSYFLRSLIRIIITLYNLFFLFRLILYLILILNWFKQEPLIQLIIQQWLIGACFSKDRMLLKCALESGCRSCCTLLREQTIIMLIDRNFFWNTVSHLIVHGQNIDAIWCSKIDIKVKFRVRTFASRLQNFGALNFSIRKTFPHNKASYGEMHHLLFHHLFIVSGIRAIPLRVQILQKCVSNKMAFLVLVPTTPAVQQRTCALSGC